MGKVAVVTRSHGKDPQRVQEQASGHGKPRPTNPKDRDARKMHGEKRDTRDNDTPLRHGSVFPVPLLRFVPCFDLLDLTFHTEIPRLFPFGFLERFLALREGATSTCLCPSATCWSRRDQGSLTAPRHEDKGVLVISALPTRTTTGLGAEGRPVRADSGECGARVPLGTTRGPGERHRACARLAQERVGGTFVGARSGRQPGPFVAKHIDAPWTAVATPTRRRPGARGNSATQRRTSRAAPGVGPETFTSWSARGAMPKSAVGQTARQRKSGPRQPRRSSSSSWTSRSNRRLVTSCSLSREARNSAAMSRSPSLRCTVGCA